MFKNNFSVLVSAILNLLCKNPHKGIVDNIKCC